MMSTTMALTAPQPTASPAAVDAGQRLRSGLTLALRGLAGAAGRVAVAPPGGLGARGDGHFHLVPELFLQIAGSTRFDFPQADLLLDAGDAVVLPPRLLHAEQVRAGADGQPFCNLVVQAEGSRLMCHLAHEAAPGRPGILHLETVQHPQAGRIHDWLADVARPGLAADSALGAVQVRALVCAAVAGVLLALDDGAAQAPAEPPLVARLRVLVQNQLGDRHLGVRGLARQSGCTADHLSQVFSRSTGEHLAAHITRLRLARAAHLLRDTGMAAKEVAWACGYASPSYFSHCFRLRHGVSPQQWRGASGATRHGGAPTAGMQLTPNR
jgi:AraC-like DNA-binding protein